MDQIEVHCIFVEKMVFGLKARMVVVEPALCKLPIEGLP